MSVCQQHTREGRGLRRKWGAAPPASCNPHTKTTTTFKNMSVCVCVCVRVRVLGWFWRYFCDWSHRSSLYAYACQLCSVHAQQVSCTFSLKGEFNVEVIMA